MTIQDSYKLPITPEELQDQSPKVDLDQLFGPARTASEANQQRFYPNKTGYRGVHRQRQKWVALITYNHRRVFLGFFDTSEQAALAYNSAALKIYGNSVRLNEVVDETMAKCLGCYKVFATQSDKKWQVCPHCGKIFVKQE